MSAQPGGTAISASLNRIARKMDYTTQDAGMLSRSGQGIRDTASRCAVVASGVSTTPGITSDTWMSLADEFGAQRLGEPTSANFVAQ